MIKGMKKQSGWPAWGKRRPVGNVSPLTLFVEPMECATIGRP